MTSSIGGKKGELVHGLAYRSTYYLAKTDDISSEPKEDELQLIVAVKWLLSKQRT